MTGDAPDDVTGESGLLGGLTGPARAERAELIAWLQAQGFSAGEIESSFSPVLLAARRALGDDGSYVSARQISESTGLDLDLLTRFQRAAGLPRVDDPDAAVFLRADADATDHIQRFLKVGIDPELMMSIVRVLAQGLANASEVMQVAALAATLHPGATEVETARGIEALARAAIPLLGPMIADMLLLQLRHSLQNAAVDVRERAAGVPIPESRMVGAAFADLVGFTALGEELPPERLEQLSNRLAELAHDVQAGEVRFIKAIGDAVMFVSTDTGALLEAVLALVAAAEQDELLPALRVGVAYGQAVSRAGDWFGSPVNTASRLTSIARPGAVLVSQAVRDDAGDDERFRWSDAGLRHLRGISGNTQLFRVRRTSRAVSSSAHDE